jgi:hypothetical protein
MRIRDSEDSDPYTNGYNNFCKLNINSNCSITNEQWMGIIDNEDPDPYTNGYNRFCKTNQGTQNCPACRVNNKKWIELNNLTETNPQKNGYTDFCLASDGTKNDWDKWSGFTVDPKYTKYNRFCQTPGAGGGGV